MMTAGAAALGVDVADGRLDRLRPSAAVSHFPPRSRSSSGATAGSTS